MQLCSTIVNNRENTMVFSAENLQRGERPRRRLRIGGGGNEAMLGVAVAITKRV
jgi:hypothetical protein